ncbi:MAG TPA: amidase, partial [Burkholderiales bacterium]|nr:amidase [Burkholderiales bacterium]
MELNALSAAQALSAIRAGEITCEELLASCLARIEAMEPEIEAWTFLDPDYAFVQARALDTERREGKPIGSLHGIPVGIKDIIDTADMPTECGSAFYSGRRPIADATVVSRLREAGAIIIGKTVTTELAVYSPGKTRNPHDPNRTPGGSSSGSAAAVAAHMIPLALGTQTHGSIIRPAAFCGVYGFKPTHGLISRAGVLKQSRALDHVGVFARSLEDIALIAEPLIGYDERDADSKLAAQPQLARVLREEPPVPPRLAFVKTPIWDEAETDTKDAFAELVEHVGERIEEVELPELFGKAHEWQRIIHEADLAKSYEREYERGKAVLSARLQEMLERGRTILAIDYQRALEGAQISSALLDDVFYRYDGIITAAAAGEAPRGLEATGSPRFCTIWTLAGVPAISLPLLEGSHGLPMGVQLVGQRGDDARLRSEERR